MPSGRIFPVGSIITPHHRPVRITLLQTPPQVIAPIGTDSAELFGSTTVAPGTVTIAPVGIPTAEQFGTIGLVPPSLRALGTVASSTTNAPSFAAPAGSISTDVILVFWFMDSGSATVRCANRLYGT